MNLKIQTKEFQELINLASRFVAKNTTLPILENIYLKTEMDNLVIKGSDMEKYIQIQYPTEILAEGAITINARTLTEILSNIDTPEIEIQINESANTLTLQTPEDKFEIKGLPATEYIAVPEVDSQEKVNISLDNISKGISMVEDCIVEKNFMAILTGMLLRVKEESDGKKLVFVGTDSFRLAEFKLPINVDFEFDVVIPKSNLTEIHKTIDFAKQKEANDVSIFFKNNLIKFDFDLPNDAKIEVTSLLLKGTYPEYEKEHILPTQFNTKIILNKNSISKAVKKIIVFTKDINNYVMLKTDEKSLLISSGKNDKGTANTSVPAIIEGEPIQISLNGKYLLDFAKLISNDEIVLNLVKENSPFLLADPNIPNFRYVIRPLD